jgi:hypothetical protein
MVGESALDDEVLLKRMWQDVREIVREESRRGMIQNVFLVSFFSWLVLINIYQSLLWSQSGYEVPNIVVWLKNVVFEALFALALAFLTLGAAYSISWLWNSR